MRCTGAHVAADGRPAKAPTAQKVRFFLVGNGDRCVAHGRSDGRPKAHSPPEARCWQVLTRTNVINEGLPKGGHSGKFWVERRVYLARVSTAPREPHTAPRPSRGNVVHSPHRRARTALQLVIRCLCPLVIRRLQHGILIKNPFLPFRDRGSFLLALNCGLRCSFDEGCRETDALSARGAATCRSTHTIWSTTVRMGASCAPCT